MKLTLRQATTADLPLISTLAQRIWRVHYPPIVGAEQVEYMLATLYNVEALHAQMQEGQVFWLPELDGETLGYLAIRQTAPGKYFLHKFYLDNEKRGKGFGKTVFQLLLEQYPDMTELRLNVNRRNYKSVNFYFRLGFTIDFCHDTPFGAGYVMDDFQMLLKLNKP